MQDPGLPIRFRLLRTVQGMRHTSCCRSPQKQRPGSEGEGRLPDSQRIRRYSEHPVLRHWQYGYSLQCKYRSRKQLLRSD